MKVTLPWPHKDLSPNARVNHFVIAKRKKAHRTGAAWEARAAGMHAMPPDVLSVRITFHPPDKRRRDMDNCLSMLKASLDGIADIIMVDDRHWNLSLAWGDVVKRGAVLVEIAPL